MAYGISPELVLENQWNRHVQFLEATCKGWKRESNMTWEYEEYTLFYDLLANEFWSDRTMEKKYKTKVQERIDERAVYSVVVHKAVKRNDSWGRTSSGFSFVNTWAPYEVKDFIWRVPRVLLCDEYAREAMLEGVPIADIIA